MPPRPQRTHRALWRSLWRSLWIPAAVSVATLAGCQRADAARGPATTPPPKPSVKTPAPAGPKAHGGRWSFEDVAVGALPAGWRVDETSGHGPHATWAVVQRPGAPSGQRVLALTDAKGHRGSTFNLCWTDQVSFRDGELSVRFRADTGREDQGGGLLWRAQDKDNYYVARFNPLEDNLRLYTVRGGHRRMLATATVKLAPHAWHTLTIVQRGTHYQASLDGKRWLEGDDDLFPGPGGVGLWTKADAATSFDDLVVRPAPAK